MADTHQANQAPLDLLGRSYIVVGFPWRAVGLLNVESYQRRRSNLVC